MQEGINSTNILHASPLSVSSRVVGMDRVVRNMPRKADNIEIED